MRRRPGERLTGDQSAASAGGRAGHQVDHAARHCHGVVGDPLVEAAAQGDVDSLLDAAFPLVLEQHVEELAVQAVDDVVVLLDLVGEHRGRRSR